MAFGEIQSEGFQRRAAQLKVSPFTLAKEKLQYSPGKFYSCENCQNVLKTRRGQFCRVLGYDPSDPESQVDDNSTCSAYKFGHLTTLEEKIESRNT